MNEKWTLTGKKMKLETNIKVLDDALDDVKKHVDGNLYEAQFKSWCGTVVECRGNVFRRRVIV